MNYVKISIYIDEADKWQHKPLHIELLNMLKQHGVASGIVLRAIAGLTPDGMEKTSLFHVGKKLPLVVQFITDSEMIEKMLPDLKIMVSEHLIINVPVEVLNGLHN